MKTIHTIILFLLLSHLLSAQKIDSLSVLYNEANYSEVIKYGEKFMESNTNNAEIYYLTGISYQQLNKFKKAQSNLEKAFLSDTSNLKYLISYASIHLINKYPKKAVSLYKKALILDSLNFNALNSLSKLYISENKYKEALKTYNSLSQKDSLNSYYYRQMAYCFNKLNIEPTSLKYYQKAYNIDSTDVLNIKAFAFSLYKNGNFKEAIEYCDKGIFTDSLYSDFYKIKGYSFEADDHKTRAISYYKKTIELGDSTYIISKRLGMILCDIEEFEEALNYNMSAYKVDTSSYLNTLYLSRNYLGLGNYEKSIEYAEKTIENIQFSKRVSLAIYDLKARTYTEMRDYESAIKMYNKKYSVFKTRYLDDNYNIAVLNDKLGNKKTALHYYQKVSNSKKKRNISIKDDQVYQYVETRITRILEDLHFEGN